MATRALIFDIGGVLLLPKDTTREKHLLSSFKEVLLLLEDFGIDASSCIEPLREIYVQSSRGALDKDETLREMSKLLGVGQQKLEESFQKAYSENIIENVELYEKILELKKKGYALGILSNQFSLSKEVLVLEKYYADFDAVVVSCDDKIRKPDAESFKIILSKLGVAPEEAVLIDDQEKNTLAAEKLGMNAIIYGTSVAQFLKELRELGID